MSTDGKQGADTPWDVLGDGGEHRQIIAVNGDGDPGIYLGKLLDELDADVGDSVAAKASPGTQTITLHFGDGSTDKPGDD